MHIYGLHHLKLHQKYLLQSPSHTNPNLALVYGRREPVLINAHAIELDIIDHAGNDKELNPVYCCYRNQKEKPPLVNYVHQLLKAYSYISC